MQGGEQTQKLFQEARIHVYQEIDKRIDRLACSIPIFSVVYVTLTVVLCETSWEGGTVNSFVIDSDTVPHQLSLSGCVHSAWLCALQAVSLAVTGCLWLWHWLYITSCHCLSLALAVYH